MTSGWRGRTELQCEVTLARRRGVRPSMSVGCEAWEGSRWEKEGVRDIVVGDGVLRSGEMIELLVIFRVEIPPLLAMESFRGEHLTGVELADFFPEEPETPKLSLLGTSARALRLTLGVVGRGSVTFIPDLISPEFRASLRLIIFLGLRLRPGLRCSLRSLALGEREQFRVEVDSVRGALAFLLDTSPGLSSFLLLPFTAGT